MIRLPELALKGASVFQVRDEYLELIKAYRGLRKGHVRLAHLSELSVSYEARPISYHSDSRIFIPFTTKKHYPWATKATLSRVYYCYHISNNPTMSLKLSRAILLRGGSHLSGDHLIRMVHATPYTAFGRSITFRIIQTWTKWFTSEHLVFTMEERLMSSGLILDYGNVINL